MTLLNKDYLFIFFLLWGVSGLTINSHDQRAFTLQQMGVDAIVRHGTFTLGHSEMPIFRPGGDTFHSEKGILPAKQPGQFTFGAIPYFVLSKIGMSYESDYVLVASLVTWLSISFVSAMALTLLFVLLKSWGIGVYDSMWAVFSVALFSHWLVYSGILHHDILAASFLVIALFFVEKGAHHPSGKYLFSALSGLFAGLTVFTSMLPALIVLAFGGYVFSSLKLKHIVFSALGFGIGLLPLALYNYHYFGNPLIQANVAGNYADTFFNFKADQFKHHFNAYLGLGELGIWKYSPIVALGLLGALLLPLKSKRLKAFILFSSFFHVMYLLNIETLGHCQYGPRYLISILPFWAIGVAFLFDWVGKRALYVKGIVLAVVGGFSLMVSLVGALGGAMECEINRFLFIKYITTPNKFDIENYPLFWWMVSLLVVIFSMGAVVNWGGRVHRYFLLKTGGAQVIDGEGTEKD